jgi:APA family basic amino acid/polyamine antiporter
MMMNEQTLKKSVGLAGAVFLIVGYVVGATIFILPGPLAAEAGPGLFISYSIASFLAVFACFVAGQVGSAFPVSGANMVIVNRVLPRYWGFFEAFILPLTIIFTLPLIAYGFSEYLSFFFPNINLMLPAILLILFFLGINLLGLQVASWAQAIMTIEFVLALLIFGIGGILKGDSQLLVPLLPVGFKPLLVAAVPAYASFFGFLFIAEIAEEVKNPTKNIPRALIIGFIIVTVIYISVPLAVTRLLSWNTLGETRAAVAVASEVFLPAWLAKVIALSALMAIATCVNGVFMANTRDFLAYGRNKIYPAIFARISKRNGSPYMGLILLASLSVFGIFLRLSITIYATVAVMCFLTFQILSGMAVLLLPKRLPDTFTASPIKLKPITRVFFSLGLIIISGIFFILAALDKPSTIPGFLIPILMSGVYYKLRINWLKNRGINIDEALKR